MNFENIRETSDTLDIFALNFIESLRLENKKWQEKSGCAVTLSGVFFHEAVKLVTSAHFRYVEMQNNLTLKSSAINTTALPYVTYDCFFAQETSSDPVEEKKIKKGALRRQVVGGLLSCINKTVGMLKPNAATVAVLDFQATKIRTFIGLLLRGYKIRIIEQPQHCFFSDFEAQYESLLEICGVALRRIPGLPVTVIEKRLQPVVLRYISTIDPGINDQVLLVGTLSKIENRVVAANFYKQNLPVVTVHHGYGSGLGVLDEPIFKYGESSFCSVVVQAGKVPSSGFFADLEPLDLLTPTYPHVVGAESKTIKNIFCSVGGQIPKISSLNEPAVMYVPTLYSGLETYAPYRGLPDEIYFRWQKYLIASLMELFTVTLKLHPKGSGAALDHDLKIERAPFEVSYRKAEVFVFDYVSTAFNIAAATDRPIIFVDLKVRNFKPAALEAIKARCLYISIEELESQLFSNVIKAKWNQSSINAYTPDYCLNPNGKTLEAQILDAVQNLVPQ